MRANPAKPKRAAEEGSGTGVICMPATKPRPPWKEESGKDNILKSQRD